SAHTPVSMAALVDALRTWGLAQSPLHLVLSFSGQRDLAALATPLLACSERVYVTRAAAARSVRPQSLASALRPHCCNGADVEVIESPQAALAAACGSATKHDIVCATGSVYMVGAARRCFSAAG